MRGLANASGALTQDYAYEPYGTPDGATPADFGFTGEQTDANGLVYLRARYYDPAISVFTALDPFEGTMQRPMSMNGYSWVEGNTPNATDPSGFVFEKYGGGGAFGTAGFIAIGALTGFALGRALFGNNGPSLDDVAEFAEQVNDGLCDLGEDVTGILFPDYYSIFFSDTSISDADTAEADDEASDNSDERIRTHIALGRSDVLAFSPFISNLKQQEFVPDRDRIIPYTAWQNTGLLEGLELPNPDERYTDLDLNFQAVFNFIVAGVASGTLEKFHVALADVLPTSYFGPADSVDSIIAAINDSGNQGIFHSNNSISTLVELYILGHDNPTVCETKTDFYWGAKTVGNMSKISPTEKSKLCNPASYADAIRKY